MHKEDIALVFVDQVYVLVHLKVYLHCAGIKTLAFVPHMT